MDYKTEFIEFLAEVGALTFGDFVTKSGRRTPYFINIGQFCDGARIARLGGFYADRAMACPGLLTERTVLFGPAYKGIALAVATASAMAGRGINLPYCFNRKEVKDHGEGGALVGHPLREGDRVLIIEDVITAGTAVREVLPILQNAGAVVDGLLISVDRMERGSGARAAARELWEDCGIRSFPIVTVRDIVEVLRNRPVDGRVLIDDAAAARMEAYMREYCVD